LFGVNGIGLGHAARSIRIANSLKDTAKIFFTSYGDGYRLLSTTNFLTFNVTPLYFRWNEYGLSLPETIISLFYESSAYIPRQLIEEYKIIRRVKPSLVISDSRGSTILAARKHGLPIITITNQLASYVSTDVRGHSYINSVSKRLMPRLWRLSEIVIVPDLPPPYTISRINIVESLEIMYKVEFVGLLDDYTKYTSISSSSKELGNRPLIYIAISGPKEDKLFFYTHILKAVPLMRDIGQVLISKGSPGTKSTEPLRVNGVTIYEWLPERISVLKGAHITIMRGGQTSIMEAIMSLTPMIIIPPQGQTEQMGNAICVEELGLGKYISQDEFLKDRGVLRKLLTEVIDDYDKYIRRLSRVMDYIVSCGGVNRVREIIIKYL
jgi:UDP:flavonoid glycosyltransferase YjiC (YdhE family)